MEYTEVLTTKGKARTKDGTPGRYGSWEVSVWAVSRGDYERAERVFRRWPLRALLHAYRELVRREEMRQYRYDYMIWTLRAPWVKEQPPEVPSWTKKELIGVR